MTYAKNSTSCNQKVLANYLTHYLIDCI